MGKIRTKTTKRAARKVVESHYGKLCRDFYLNKRVILDVTVGTSKKLKNKIAGYTTHIMKRLARGPVKGISLKLQEEERERRMDFVPEVSWAVQKVSDGITVDPLTLRMLKKLETGVPKNVRQEREEVVEAKPVRGRGAGGRGGRGAARGGARGGAGRGEARGSGARGASRGGARGASRGRGGDKQ